MENHYFRFGVRSIKLLEASNHCLASLPTGQLWINESAKEETTKSYFYYDRLSDLVAMKLEARLRKLESEVGVREERIDEMESTVARLEQKNTAGGRLPASPVLEISQRG